MLREEGEPVGKKVVFDWDHTVSRIHSHNALLRMMTYDEKMLAKVIQMQPDLFSDGRDLHTDAITKWKPETIDYLWGEYKKLMENMMRGPDTDNPSQYTVGDFKEWQKLFIDLIDANHEVSIASFNSFGPLIKKFLEEIIFEKNPILINKYLPKIKVYAWFPENTADKNVYLDQIAANAHENTVRIAANVSPAEIEERKKTYKDIYFFDDSEKNIQKLNEVLPGHGFHLPTQVVAGNNLLIKYRNNPEIIRAQLETRLMMRQHPSTLPDGSLLALINNTSAEIKRSGISEEDAIKRWTDLLPQINQYLEAGATKGADSGNEIFAAAVKVAPAFVIKAIIDKGNLDASTFSDRLQSAITVYIPNAVKNAMERTDDRTLYDLVRNLWKEKFKLESSSIQIKTADEQFYNPVKDTHDSTDVVGEGLYVRVPPLGEVSKSVASNVAPAEQSRVRASPAPVTPNPAQEAARPVSPSSPQASAAVSSSREDVSKRVSPREEADLHPLSPASRPLAPATSLPPRAELDSQTAENKGAEEIISLVNEFKQSKLNLNQLQDKELQKISANMKGAVEYFKNKTGNNPMTQYKEVYFGDLLSFQSKIKAQYDTGKKIREQAAKMNLDFRNDVQELKESLTKFIAKLDPKKEKKERAKLLDRMNKLTQLEIDAGNFTSTSNLNRDKQEVVSWIRDVKDYVYRRANRVTFHDTSGWKNLGTHLELSNTKLSREIGLAPDAPLPVKPSGQYRH